MAAGDGLISMTPSSIAFAGGGSETASINSDGGVDFSAVTSLSLNDVFTSSFDNYLVVVNLTATTGILASMRLRASGTDNSASDYTFQFLDVNNTNRNAVRSTSQNFTYWILAGNRPSGMLAHFYGPALAEPTAWRTITSKNDSTAPGELFETATTHSASTSFDGFTMYSSAMTGNVHVFGYEE